MAAWSASGGTNWLRYDCGGSGGRGERISFVGLVLLGSVGGPGARLQLGDGAHLVLREFDEVLEGCAVLRGGDRDRLERVEVVEGEALRHEGQDLLHGAAAPMSGDKRPIERRRRRQQERMGAGGEGPAGGLGALPRAPLLLLQLLDAEGEHVARLDLSCTRLSGREYRCQLLCARARGGASQYLQTESFDRDGSVQDGCLPLRGDTLLRGCC